MKKFTKLFAMILSFILVFSSFAGCAAIPLELDANKEISLDLFEPLGKKSAEIVIADYIDENGAKDLTYSVSSRHTRVSLSSIRDGKFTITAVTAGNTEVDIKAKSGDQELITVTLSVKVTNSTPAIYTFSLDNAVDDEGFTLEFDGTAYHGYDYSFKLKTNYGFDVSSDGITLDYKVGDTAAASPLTGTLVSGTTDTYSFAVSKTILTGNITITAVNGISIAANTFKVEPLTNAFNDFIFGGYARAFADEDYTFTLSQAAMVFEAPEIVYTVDDVPAAEPAELVSDEGGIFTYKIDSENLAEDATLAFAISGGLTVGTKNFGESFYTADSWITLDSQEEAPAAVADTVDEVAALKFTDTVRRIPEVADIFTLTSVTSTHHVNKQFSFMLKADGEFDVLLFATASATTNGEAWKGNDNWIRFFSENGSLYFGHHRAAEAYSANNAKVAKIWAEKNGNDYTPFNYVPGAWNRYDIVVQRFNNQHIALRLFIDGVPVVFQQLYNPSDYVEQYTQDSICFRTNGTGEYTRPNSQTLVAVQSGPSFGARFVVRTQPGFEGRSVWLAPVPDEGAVPAATKVDVDITADDEAYNVHGANSVNSGMPYYGTITANRGFGGSTEANAVVVRYTVDGEAETVSAIAMDDSGKYFRFTIENPTQDIEITSVTGIAILSEFEVTASWLFASDGYQTNQYLFEGTEFGVTDANYEFTIKNVDSMLAGSAATVYYQVDSTEVKTVTVSAPDETEGNLYTFAIPAADLPAGSRELKLLGINFAELQSYKEIPDAFWSTASWITMNGGDSQPAPTLDGNALKFENTFRRVFNESIFNTAQISNASGALGAIYQYSYMIKAEANFDSVILATGNTTWTDANAWGNGNNYIRFYSEAGQLKLGHHAGGSSDKNYMKPMALVMSDYQVGEWNRIDIIITRVHTNRLTLNIYVNGKVAELDRSAEGVEYAPTDASYAISYNTVSLACNSPNYGQRFALRATTPVWLGKVADFGVTA